MDPTVAIFSIVALLVSGIFHEQCHARVALWLGDPTGKMQNRLSWNPRYHIDLWMTIILPILLLVTSQGRFIFGGMKPVRINPLNFANPPLGMALSAAAGPVSNALLAAGGIGLLGLAQAVAPSLVLDRETTRITFNGLFLCIFIQVNFVLGAFNIIPLPGLDGSRILYYFLPRAGRALMDQIEPYALLITMFIVFNVGGLLTPVWTLFATLLVAAGGEDFYSAFVRQLR